MGFCRGAACYALRREAHRGIMNRGSWEWFRKMSRPSGEVYSSRWGLRRRKKKHPLWFVFDKNCISLCCERRPQNCFHTHLKCEML